MKWSSYVQLWRIIYYSYRFGIDDLLYQIPFFKRFGFLYYSNPLTWFSTTRRLPLTVRIPLFLEALGPLYIKLGQLLSTRTDMFSKEVVDCLSRLRDKVEPFNQAQLHKQLTIAYGDYTTVITTISPTPMASASIAQVHRATLTNGKPVVLKVVRPNIEKFIKRDLQLLQDIQSLILTMYPSFKRFNIPDILKELQRVLFTELDLRNEAKAIRSFKQQYQHLPSRPVILPTINYELSNQTVLVMDELHGVSLTELERLDTKNISRTQIAKLILDIFFEQIFYFEHFHADIHPGNIFIDIQNPAQPQLILLDFGIIGRLSKRDKYYLAKNIFALLDRDFEMVASLHIDSEWLPDETDIPSFIRDLEEIVTMLHNKEIKDISFGKILFSVFSTAKKHKINIQPQLLLLQKTVLHLESLARQLDPSIDLWAYSKPKIKQWLTDQRSITNSVKRFVQVLQMADTILSTQSFETINKQFIRLTKQTMQTHDELLILKKSQTRLTMLLIIATLLLGMIYFFRP
ncbi:MAG: AarF/UbiB family protein [Methylacidiphilales bacterium]|nr:AarF/UbiB family protein [Candidatus Methylacidiphilales bacterium]